MPATPVSSASRGQQQRDFLGLSFTALCGGALAVNMVLILALLALIGWQGGRYFWQRGLIEVELADGRKLLRDEVDEPLSELLEHGRLPPDQAAEASQVQTATTETAPLEASSSGQGGTTEAAPRDAPPGSESQPPHRFRGPS